MPQYTFPCIITEGQDIFSAVFPDLNNRKVYGTNIYDVLKSAAHVLLIEIYVQEQQRMSIPMPTPINTLKLQPQQFVSMVICDTDVLGNVLDLYENVQADDLLDYFRNKDAQNEILEIEQQDAQALNEDEDDEDEKNENEDNKHSTDEIDFIDEIEVIVPNNSEITSPPPSSEIEEIPAPPEIEIPEPPEPTEAPQRQNPKRYKRNYNRKKN